MRFVRKSARGVVSRAGAAAMIALWCLLSLVSGATQALCLDLGGGCSPSAAVPAGPCHDEAPDDSRNPGCGSCVDIVVPDDVSISGGRPDRDFRAPAAAQSPALANLDLGAMEHAAGAASSPLLERCPPHPFLRAAVLRI